MGHDPGLFEQILGDNTMSKKKILEESTIRRFMKLASIGGLTENYFEYEKIIAVRKLLEKCESMQYTPITVGKNNQLIDESVDLLKEFEKQA